MVSKLIWHFIVTEFNLVLEKKKVTTTIEEDSEYNLLLSVRNKSTQYDSSRVKL